MMLMTNDVLAAQFAPSDATNVRSVSLLPREQRDAIREFSSLVGTPPSSQITVAVHDIVVKSTPTETSPVQYIMRVRCDLSGGATWVLKPHRYSDFETLHKKLRTASDTEELKAGEVELPRKHLIPTRKALIQRAVELQQYCCAILSNPAALRHKEVSA